MEVSHCLDGRLAILRKTDDIEPLELEQGPGRGTKVLVVVDDQQRLPHDRRIVA